MGLGDSVRSWLEGDPSNSFFEFKTSPDDDYCTKFKNLELIVSKTYYASGIIVIMIIFQVCTMSCLTYKHIFYVQYDLSIVIAIT